MFPKLEFHKDLPRWAIDNKLVVVLDRYYDKRRKIEFIRVQRLIAAENQKNPDQTPKGLIGEVPILDSETLTKHNWSSEASYYSKSRMLTNSIFIE